MATLSLAIVACSAVRHVEPLKRESGSRASLQRQDLEWVNDVSRRVLADPNAHADADTGKRQLVDSIWQAVVDEARQDPTGPRREFFVFSNSLAGLPYDERSRRVHAWFLRAGWVLWGRPTRRHPDVLLRLTGGRIDTSPLNDALDEVFEGFDVTFNAPWTVDISTQPLMAWSSPGVPVVNEHQVDSISQRMYGRRLDKISQLKNVIAGLTMVEEAIQWRVTETRLRDSQDDLVTAEKPVARLTGRNIVQTVAMAVALNIDRTAFDLYDIQLRQCDGGLDTDACRHLIPMAELVPGTATGGTTPSRPLQPARTIDVATRDRIRQRYTVVARELLSQLYE